MVQICETDTLTNLRWIGHLLTFSVGSVVVVVHDWLALESSIIPAAFDFLHGIGP